MGATVYILIHVFQYRTTYPKEKDRQNIITTSNLYSKVVCHSSLWTNSRSLCFALDWASRQHLSMPIRSWRSCALWLRFTCVNTDTHTHTHTHTSDFVQGSNSLDKLHGLIFCCCCHYYYYYYFQFALRRTPKYLTTLIAYPLQQRVP